MALTVTPDSGIFLVSHALAPVSIPFSTTGGRYPYTYYVSSGELPPGLTLDPHTGLLSGIPTGIRNDTFVSDEFVYQFNIKVTDSSVPKNKYVIDSYTYSILTPRLSSTPYAPILFPSSNSVIRNSKNNTITVKSANNPTEYQILTFPDNGTISVNGLNITYTPNENFIGIDDIVIVGVNAGGVSNDANITVSVLPEAPLTSPTDNVRVITGSIDIPIDLNIAGIYDAVVINDPTSNGSIYINGTTAFYTPDVNYTGLDSFTFSVSNISGVATATVNIIVEIPTIISLPESGELEYGVYNTPYNPITLTVSGGTAPYSLILLNGSLPAGLTLESNIISGTPMATGQYNFTIAITDSHFPNQFTVYNDYQLKVFATNDTSDFQWLTFPGLLFTATSGISVVYELYTSEDNVSYNVLTGSLPSGLELQSDGVIVGTPDAVSESQNYKFVVRAINQENLVTDCTFTILVEPSLEPIEPIEFAMASLFAASLPVIPTDIYLKPFMPVEQRTAYANFINSSTVFVPSYILQSGDATPKLYLEYGIEALESAGSYESALDQNFYDKTLYFGDVKSLATTEYDVVYVEMVDPMDNVKPSVDFVYTGTDFITTATYYPSSLQNMRSRLESLSGVNGPIGLNLNDPLYIQTAKTLGLYPLNAVVLCLALPGKGGKIVSRIKKQIKKKLFTFNQFDFTVDRLVIENTAISTASSYLIFPKRTI